MQLSIITTLYRSSATIEEFIHRITTSVEQITEDYELIIVNDGSPDDALDKVLIAQQQNEKITAIDLSRNFGHHEAGMAGMEHACGDFIFLIDSDLEEAPELLSEFWHFIHQNPQFDMVYGVQEQRKGNWFEKQSGALFYKLFNRLSHLKISPNTLTIRIMTKQYVDTLCQYQERHVFLAGIMAHAGFNQHTLTVHKKSKGSTSYTLSKRLKLFFICISSFSSQLPVTLLFIGAALICSSLLAIGYHAIGYLIAGSPVSLLMAFSLATSLIIGSILSCTGLLGTYLTSISNEVKQRPRAVIRAIFTKQQKPH